MNAPVAGHSKMAHGLGHRYPEPPHCVEIAIFIDEAKYVVHEPELTGRQLKALASIAEANQLFLDVPGHGDDTPVQDDVPFELKPGMKFYDVPAGNLGAR
jgi:hypothetical protein